jgi:hypothetical protein
MVEQLGEGGVVAVANRRHESAQMIVSRRPTIVRADCPGPRASCLSPSSQSCARARFHCWASLAGISGLVVDRQLLGFTRANLASILR